MKIFRSYHRVKYDQCCYQTKCLIRRTFPFVTFKSTINSYIRVCHHIYLEFLDKKMYELNLSFDNNDRANKFLSYANRMLVSSCRILKIMNY